ncbi:2OG-Fe(II) oxygenase [Sphingomonas sp. LB3N6]|uniref:2OG-Fe(II) oxygenase n=1 Tax=Sphingomonas fucosidasi TaxID=3096164 RepID=UPI002FCBBD64
MHNDPIADAQAMLAAGRHADAVALVARHAAAGDAAALFQQGMWHLTGVPLPRDVPAARALLRQATERGSIDAGLIEVALTGNGSGATADWARAVSLLEQVARHSEQATGELGLLRKMALTATGAPAQSPKPRKIGERPNVYHIPELFSSEECLHVAQCAVDILKPAVVVDPRTGRDMANPVRTSDAAVIGPTRETLVIQALNRRLAAVTGTDWRQGEALSVLRYQPGQQFRPHVDALPGTRNQRIRTVLIYLNEGFSGGATYFVHNALRVVPRAGDAIIFDNVRTDGSIDPLSQHAGEPVTNGVKWLATRWIRMRPFSPWTGPEHIA